MNESFSLSVLIHFMVFRHKCILSNSIFRLIEYFAKNYDILFLCIEKY
jgi:hypothetical protein